MEMSYEELREKMNQDEVREALDGTAIYNYSSPKEFLMSPEAADLRRRVAERLRNKS